MWQTTRKFTCLLIVAITALGCTQRVPTLGLRPTWEHETPPELSLDGSSAAAANAADQMAVTEPSPGSPNHLLYASPASSQPSTHHFSARQNAATATGDWDEQGPVEAAILFNDPTAQYATSEKQPVADPSVEDSAPALLDNTQDGNARQLEEAKPANSTPRADVGRSNHGNTPSGSPLQVTRRDELDGAEASSVPPHFESSGSDSPARRVISQIILRGTATAGSQRACALLELPKVGTRIVREGQVFHLSTGSGTVPVEVLRIADGAVVLEISTLGQVTLQ